VVAAGVSGDGCKSSRKERRAAVEAARVEGLTGGVEVFSDDFNRADLGDRWTRRSPGWDLRDGWLHVRGDKNEGLWLNERLPDRVRVEFDAKAATDEGDLKFEIFNTEQRHQTGYIVIFGGWHNSVSIIARLNEHGEDRQEAPEVPARGRVYRFAAVRTDGTLRWFVDGKLVLEFADEAPIRGSFFGFNNWNAEAFFDNLKVFRL
jgi:hypothetical protein